MSEVELPEIEELEEASRNREHKRIGLVISVIAILLAVCGAFGQKSDNNEIVARVSASNTWAYFQAKKLRAYQSETGRDLVGLIAQGRSPSQQEGAATLIRKYTESHDRYEAEAKEISQKADAFSREADHWEARGDRFDLAEICLQIAVVLCSVCILTSARLFLFTGIGFASVGAFLGFSAFLI